MRTSTVIYILLFFTIWTQVDNFAAGPFFPTPAGWVALDDDEYVAPKGNQSRERSSSRQASEVAACDWTVDRLFLARRDSRVPNCLTAPSLLGPSLLYTLMSLQC
jgi:hypothetical protein